MRVRRRGDTHDHVTRYPDDMNPLPVLKALADPVRWHLVVTLANGPRTTGALAQGLTQTRFGVMKHLEVLVAAGLVTVERRGRERWNHLNPVPLSAVLDAITNPLSRDWSARLLRLRHAVERQETAMTPPRMIDLRQQIALPAPPDRVFQILTRDIDLWWTAPYRMTEGGRMSLEAHVNGELREQDGSGHVAIWGKVEEVMPGRLLVLSGTFGMTLAVAGRVRIELVPEDDATRLTLHHMAVGPLVDDVSDHYARGWADLLDIRLRARLETA